MPPYFLPLLFLPSVFTTVAPTFQKTNQPVTASPITPISAVI